MVIKLPITQIPKYWELIKLGAMKSDEVEERFSVKYCNKLLIDLYSEKLICVLQYNENKEILSVAIIAFKVNEETGQRYLFGKNLFAIKQNELTDWQEAFTQLVNLAKSEDCEYIVSESSNERMCGIMSKCNLLPKERKYKIDL